MSKLKAQNAPSFGGSKSATVYDTSAVNPLGGLSTGIGYDPKTADGTTKTVQAIGGATYTIKAHNPLSNRPLVTEKGENIVTDSGEEIVS